MKSLVSLLREYSIPFDRWGVGGAKTLRHLEKEVREGEAVLLEENGQLVRLATVMYVSVKCKIEDEMFRLREDRQVFVDGRVRIRSYMWGSLAEKLKSGESPDKEVVIRALTEEIGVSRVVEARFVKKEMVEEQSLSYPGLLGRFTNHKWIVELHQRDFRPDGYVEVQSDKSTYFIWECVEETEAF